MNPIPVHRIIGYARVSTEEQVRTGTSLDGQREQIEAECDRRGWHLIEVIDDAGVSGKSLRRPGVQRALDALEAGDADALVVAKQDRLTRSSLDFATLLDRGRPRGWALTALDAPDLDTSTAAGELLATQLAAVSQLSGDGSGSGPPRGSPGGRRSIRGEDGAKRRRCRR